MWASYFLRCWRAKTLALFRVQFFRPGTLFWNIGLPIFWGLQFYFQYLPFGAAEITESMFNLTMEIPLVGYTLTGQFVWAVFINASLYGGVYFLYERLDQTLETLFMSPAPRTAVMLGASTAGLLNFFWFLGVFSLIMIILQVPIVVNDIFSLLLALGLTIFAMVSAGLILQGIFIGSRIGDSLATAIQEPLMFLSGLAFPIRYLPKALLIIALSLPLSYGLFVFRGTLMSGLVLSDIAEPLAYLFMISVAIMILSIEINRLIERKMKRDATTVLF